MPTSFASVVPLPACNCQPCENCDPCNCNPCKCGVSDGCKCNPCKCADCKCTGTESCCQKN
uniref:Cu-metallothionein 4 n=1 Tax=Tetrahymena borealis TaxID=5893 RepID=A0A172QP70_TETBO|nr:Cu-metallothionein 4 [Tetrahymena borealis]